MSQTDLILEALQRGEALTKLAAFRLGAGLSLNSRVADLRRQGYRISCTTEKRNGKTVWVYRLDVEAPKGQVEMFGRDWVREIDNLIEGLTPSYD